MASNQPLVSVLVPTYQQEKFIEDCLKSIIKQKVAFDIEILVGDDCSSDSTAKVIESIAKFDDRVVLYRWPQNEGGLKNIDKLLERAQGKYVSILEGDDYWLDLEHLAKSLRYLESNPDCIFSAANYLHLVDGLLSQKQKLSTSVNRTVHFWQLALGNFIQMGTLVYRRQFYPRVPPYFIDLPLGDYPLIMSLLNNGDGVYLKHTVMAYRVHSGGIWSGQSSVIQAEKTLKTISALLTHLKLSPFKVALLNGFKARLQLQAKNYASTSRLPFLFYFTLYFVLYMYRAYN